MATNPYLITAPTLVYDFSDDPATWTMFDLGHDTGVLEASGAPLVGSGSLRVRGLGTAGGHYTRGHKDLSVDLTGTGSDTDLITLLYGFEGSTNSSAGEPGQDLGLNSSVRLLCSVGPFTRYAWYTSHPGQNQTGHRDPYDVLTSRKSDFSYVSGFTNADWALVDRIAIYANAVSPTDTGEHYHDVTAHALYIGGDATPVITWANDDNHDNAVGSVGELNAAGWHCTLFVNRDRIDTANNLTKAELDTLFAAGNNVCSHTSGHEALTIDGEAATLAGTITGYDWVKQNYAPAPPVHAYTRGEFNQALQDQTNNLGFKCVRGALRQRREPVQAKFGYGSSNLIGPDIAPIDRHIRIINLDAAGAYGTAAAVTPLIDLAVQNKQTLHFYYHEVVASGAGAGQINQAEFTSIVNYAAASGATNMAFDEWAEATHGPFGTGGGPLARRRRR